MADTANFKTFLIPGDVAEHLRRVESVMQASVARLEYLHKVWGEGEEDDKFEEWHLEIAHSEAERLIESLRRTGSFAGWLAQFGAEGIDRETEGRGDG